MTRQQLEHVIRAAAATVNVREIVVVGSQSILASHPNVTGVLAESLEADVYPLDDPDAAVVIDGAIGEMSLFHSTFGYFAHGVGPETAMLPAGWQYRMVKIETPATMGAIGWCLDPNDLVVSKLAAGRPKDLVFCEAAVTQGFADPRLVIDRLGEVPRLHPHRRELAEDWLTRFISPGTTP